MKALLRYSLACLLAAVVAAPSLSAQDSQPVRLSFEQPPTPRAIAGIATINPFAIIFGGFNGDVEMNVGVGTTAAVSATYFTDEDVDHKSIDFTFRYYPGEINPRGFSVGASLGYLDQGRDRGVAGEPSEGKGIAIGFIGGYNWLLGRSERLAIATGLGAKRLFVSKDKYPGAQVAAITGRLGVGLSF
ncbi:hypothetical protein BH23GEM1_BH23GEM1_01030 [soil metagenome]